MQLPCLTPGHCSVACSWLTISRAQNLEWRQRYSDEASSTCLCVDLGFSAWLVTQSPGELYKDRDAGLSPESESQRMMSKFISMYVTFFFKVPRILWSCELLVELVKLKWSHAKQVHTRTFLGSPVKLAHFFFSFF